MVTGHGGQQVRVAKGKPRSLLAVLAVQAGDVVSVDVLAESIWASRLPATWEVTLRNYIMRLRASLGADVGGRIVTSSRGYVLTATADEIDLLAFEVLWKAGLAAARAGDWPRASARLSEAGALWRGQPFSDIPARGIRDTHLGYLQEARLAVLEARIDADLRVSLSRAADVVPELRRLAGQHPERERFRGQLMLALYRCGRQADALAAFGAARRFSIEELGIEPGPELIALHRRMLAADRELLTSGGLPGQGVAGRGDGGWVAQDCAPRVGVAEGLGA